ncbi:carbohydrate-binding module family 20 domain-containing protein [Candidatus Finniella inopinata]|uniref:CBM20 domain-containing protein n=1 Tax=Candidatus Finniella inopinata TaxID=1696036 RepID=A0A4Q7DI62_9PROT|nr:carbohydrate-binding module family 20 domain-containing protein [Candidatus Finniella inopinata]RZI45644.1 hypothetical protein EQU50_05955 [Candidatus Finniella inopinata]
MKKLKVIISLSILGVLGFSKPVQAITSATLNGTLLFNPGAASPTKALINSCRIFHAFDLPYHTPTSIGPSFAETPKYSDYTPGRAAATDPIDSNLATIANRGYTHILVSPAQASSPSIPLPPLNASYGQKLTQQLVTQPLSGGGANTVLPIFRYSYNAWECAYQPMLCVLDYQPPSGSGKSYQDELDGVFGKNGDGSSKKLVSQYGVSVNGKVVGYRLGCDRYGSMADLVALITNARAQNLGIIVDVVFNQTSGYMTNYAGGPTGPQPDSTGKYHSGPGLLDTNYKQFHPYNYTNSGTGPATFAWDPNVDLTPFFDPYVYGGGGPKSWGGGPHLDSTKSDVQKMMVGYLRLLSDIGVAGVRFDLLYGVGAQATTSILAGTFNGVKTSSLFQSTFPLSFGYGENDQSLSAIATYGATVPVEDHPLHYSLTSCLTYHPDTIGGGSAPYQPTLPPISNLIMPTALGNITASTFSTNHDQYIGVSTNQNEAGFYYIDSGITSPPIRAAQLVTNTVTSQLAIAYICSKRDGNPLVLRFEDEQDTLATIVQRALAFRVLMGQQNAPHEYIVDLTKDVLLIVRQFGFVILNRAITTYTTATADILNKFSTSDAQLYIPAGTYAEVDSLSPLPLPSQTLSAPPTRTGVFPAMYVPTSGSSPSNSFSISLNSRTVTPATQTYSFSPATSLGSLTAIDSLSVPGQNARFFVLQTPVITPQNSYSVTFQVGSPSSIINTDQTNQVFVCGNHPILGNWSTRPDSLNGLLRKQSYSSNPPFPSTWTSLPLWFPSGVSLKYKFVAKVNGSLKWESDLPSSSGGPDRSYKVSGTGPVAATPSW